MTEIIGGQQVAPNGSVLGYRPSVAAAYRVGLTSADDADVEDATVLALDKIYCDGLQSIGVSMRGTAAAGTMVTRLIRYDQSDVIISVEEFTLTLYSVLQIGSEYFSNTWAADTESCAYVRVHRDAASAGTMAVWVGVY